MAQAPQNSLAGANADTATPQVTQAPVQLNPYKMQNQEQSAQMQGMPAAQSVAKAAENPSNQYAQGGSVQQSPQSPQSDFDKKVSSFQADPAALAQAEKALKGVPATQKSKYDNEMSDAFSNQLNQDVQHKAKGGDVHASIKNMPLKDIVKLLASHPDVAGGLGGQQPGMKKGGAVNMKTENRQPGGLLNMNADVGTYADGGPVNSPVMPTYTPQKPPQPLQMDTGGSIEADNITGYGPDGTPIVENADGTSSYGDINQELGRPESAPTIGTGQTPTTGVSTDAANSVAGASSTNSMAKGGEESGVPPGSLSKEVADDVPAKLSQGEFVFSADVVRYYGLKLLNQMMEHARGELQGMEKEGNIRSPGDDKNPDEQKGMLGQFVQDKTPDLNTYDDQGGNTPQDQSQDNDDPTGILKECMGGGMAQGGGVTPSQESQDEQKFETYIQNEQAQNLAASKQNPDTQNKKQGGLIHYNEGGAVPQMGMAQGGGIAEEDFAQGGAVGSSGGATQDYGDSNVLQDYAKGGVVTSTSTSLAPKKFSSEIPAIKAPISAAPKATAAHMTKPAKIAPPASISNFKKGGLIHNMNETNELNPTQSSVG